MQTYIVRKLREHKDEHALLGQSVASAPVKALFKRIGQGLLAWAGSATEMQNPFVNHYHLGRATG
jgi:hypothetical protein